MRNLFRIPKDIQDFDFAMHICTQTKVSDQRCWEMESVNRCGLRPEKMRQSLGCHLSTPVSTVWTEVGLVCPIRIRCTKSLRIQLRTQGGGIKANPFLQQSLGVE